MGQIAKRQSGKWPAPNKWTWLAEEQEEKLRHTQGRQLHCLAGAGPGEGEMGWRGKNGRGYGGTYAGLF